jgi:hypothetical protein
MFSPLPFSHQRDKDLGRNLCIVPFIKESKVLLPDPLGPNKCQNSPFYSPINII